MELGQQHPLKLHERIALIYNSPLCLHCNCKREKFDKERAQLRAIERERKAKRKCRPEAEGELLCLTTRGEL